MAHNGNGVNGGGAVHSSEGRPLETSGALEGTKALKKGPWTAAEDQILMEYVRKHGEGNWNSVQRNSGLNRCGKSCRLRWANHLRPNLRKGAFTPEEERLILELHAKYGNKWARMASQVKYSVFLYIKFDFFFSFLLFSLPMLPCFFFFFQLRTYA